MKKANKGHEGQTKARESRIPKFYDFFISTGSFGVVYWQIWMFLSFKAIKAKKDAVVAKETKLKIGKYVDSKILSNHLVRCFNVPFVQIWIPDSKLGILKAKMYLKGHKIVKFQNNSLYTFVH